MIAQKVKETILEVAQNYELFLDIDEIHNNSHLQDDLCLEYNEIIEVVLALEDKYNIDMSLDVVCDLETVQDIIDYFEAYGVYL